MSIEFDRCRLVCFDLNKFKITNDANCKYPDGSDFVTMNYSIEFCTKTSGFSLNDWATKIIPWKKELEQFYIDTCKLPESAKKQFN